MDCVFGAVSLLKYTNIDDGHAYALYFPSLLYIVPLYLEWQYVAFLWRMGNIFWWIGQPLKVYQHGLIMFALILIPRGIIMKWSIPRFMIGFGTWAKRKIGKVWWVNILLVGFVSLSVFFIQYHNWYTHLFIIVPVYYPLGNGKVFPYNDLSYHKMLDQAKQQNDMI